MVYEEDLLPQPIWTVQTIKDIIDIPNELNNTDKLFLRFLIKNRRLQLSSNPSRNIKSYEWYP